MCSDHKPSVFASLQAFCETLEESNYRLQKELQEKQKEIVCLKKRLEEKEQAIMQLEKQIKLVEHSNIKTHTVHYRQKIGMTVLSYIMKSVWTACLCVSACPSGEYVSPESPCGLSAQGSESSADADVESSTAEADQDMPDDTG